MKRFFAFVCTLALLLSLWVFPASAAGSGSLSLSGGSGQPGDTVTLSVSLSSNPGLISMKFTISYPEDLELTGVSNTGTLGGWTTPSPTISSPYTIRWADSLAAANNTANGKLVRLTFKIKDSAAPGKKTVKLNFSESRDVDGGKNSFNSDSATVTVNCATHSYGDWAKADGSNHSRTCSACGKAETQKHGWNGGTVTKEASCKEAGTKSFTCTTCDATKTEDIPKTNDHKYGAWSKKDDSSHQRTCSVCEKVATEKHKWNSGTVTKAASCKEAGVKTYTCSVCDATKTEDIPKTSDHKFSAWSKKDGASHQRACSVCEKAETQKHEYSAQVIQKATCKAEGSKRHTCKICGDTYTEAIPKLTTHTYDHGCDTDCNVCGLVRTTTHTWSKKWSKDKTGHWHKCTECGEKKDESEHIPGPEATEKKAQKCTECGYVLKAALGHKHKYSDKWTADEKGHWHKCSGCEKQGSYADHGFENPCDPDCGLCGYTRETAHSFTVKSDEAQHWQECEACGLKEEAQAHIPGAEATEEAAQVCTDCGYELAPALVKETTAPETVPTETAPAATEEPTEPAGPGLLPWIIGLVLALLAAVLLFLGKKKK